MLVRRQFCAGLLALTATAGATATSHRLRTRVANPSQTSLLPTARAQEPWLHLTLEGLSETAGHYGVLQARLADQTQHPIQIAGAVLPEVWNRRTGLLATPWFSTALNLLHQHTNALPCRIRQNLWHTATVNRFGVKQVRLITATGDLTQSLLAAGSLIAAPTDRQENDPLSTSEKQTEINADFTSEAQGRNTQAGLWGAGFRILSADETADFTQDKRGFVIVRGTVYSYDGLIRTHGKAQNNFQSNFQSGFLNFGSRPKRDFSVRLTTKAAKHLAQVIQTPNQLQGQTLEVRGWLEWRGGPYIALNHFSRLRIL